MLHFIMVLFDWTDITVSSSSRPFHFSRLIRVENYNFEAKRLKEETKSTFN